MCTTEGEGGGVGSEGIAYTRCDGNGAGGGASTEESYLQPASLLLHLYMIPQVDRGLAMWQVQADWQYWRTVW